MDEISFGIDDELYEMCNWECVSIFINSRNLKDFVREVELPYAIQQGLPKMAGKYQGLPAKVALLPSRHFLGEPYFSYGFKSYLDVLVCPCGEPMCSPLTTTTILTETEIVWHNFNNPIRGRPSRQVVWKYDLLGPFRFDRKQFEDALKKATECR